MSPGAVPFPLSAGRNTPVAMSIAPGNVRSSSMSNTPMRPSAAARAASGNSAVPRP